MNNSLKGALWSALIFPGSGQIALGRWKRGLPFSIFTFTLVIILFVCVFQGVWNGLEQDALLGKDVSFALLLEKVSASLQLSGKYFLPPIFVCWLLSVLDAWQLGRD